MPQSLAHMAVHFVFSTKNREPWILGKWEKRLYDYIGNIVLADKSSLLAAGGTADHVHLLISLGREVSLAEMTRSVKANSSKWIHETFPDAPFAWQEGYGAFAVSYSKLDAVRNYLARQKQHHAKRSFQHEYRVLLRKHGLDWDERYVWD